MTIFTPAHEIGHLLGIDHVMELWNLMDTPTSTTKAANGSKRFSRWINSFNYSSREWDDIDQIQTMRKAKDQTGKEYLK